MGAPVVPAAMAWAAPSTTSRAVSHDQAPIGAKKGSKQSKATNLITANQATAGAGGPGAAPGIAQAGTGGTPGGTNGQVFPGNRGRTGTAGTGVGGGLDLIAGGTVVIDNTTLTGNTATTSNNDVFGTFTT